MLALYVWCKSIPSYLIAVFSKLLTIRAELKSTAYGKTLLKGRADKCSLVEFSATALGDEATRAFFHTKNFA